MIKIERDFETLAKEHYLGLKPLLNKRIEEISDPTIKFFFKEHKKLIITGKPEELGNFLMVNCTELKKYSKIKFLRTEKSISYLFDYKFFIDEDNLPLYYTTKYKGYKLAEMLQVNVCPYCNRNFTNTVKIENGNKVVRPEFDHFYSQKDHPFLALSFYNLIPSCHTCNHIKSDDPFNINTHFHPYFNGFEKDISFNYLPINLSGVYGKPGDIKIKIEEKTKTSNLKLKNAKNVFKYEEIYSHHGDIIEEIVTKLYKGSHSYFESLRDTFSYLNLTEAEMYRIAFGNYMENIDHEKRPFAKLTKDIFEKLK